tara:strand:- start:217 stop:777 length:561 start_codon:yes stop_codon:yes gene_type:complete
MYGILSLIGKKYGKDAMRRVLEITRKHPDAHAVQTLQNRGAPRSWYETGEHGGRGGIADSSRLAAAEGLVEGSSRYLNPHPGTFMNYARHKIKKPGALKGILNYYRLNPDKRKILDDYYRDTGGEGKFSQSGLDHMLTDAFRNMARGDLSVRNLTDHEKFMIAVARQRRQKEIQRQAKIIPFPKRD